jgi:hypothetical protein
LFFHRSKGVGYRLHLLHVSPKPLIFPGCIHLISQLKWWFNKYMCTLNFLYCVFTIYNCIGSHPDTRICYHSNIFVYLFIINYCRLYMSSCIILILEIFPVILIPFK